MGLPHVPLPRDVVVVADEKVEVRGLSRAEVLRLQSFKGDPNAAEAFVLAQGAGVPEEDAQAWLAATPPEDAGVVLDRICELSGITEEGASKSNGAGPPERRDRPDGVPAGGDAGNVAG